MSARGDRFTWKNVNGKLEKVLDETSYRVKLQTMARTIGCEKEYLIWQDKYDRLLRTCKNKSEYKAIQAMGVKELSDLLDNGNVGVGGDLHIYDEEEHKIITLVDDRGNKLS